MPTATLRHAPHPVLVAFVRGDRSELGFGLYFHQERPGVSHSDWSGI